MSEERRRMWIVVAVLAVAVATALIGAYVYSLPSISEAPPPPAASSTP